MTKLKNNIYTTIIVVIGFFIYFIMLTNSIYYHTVDNKAVDRIFEISGLVSKKAVQNFDFGNKNEVFVTQMEKFITGPKGKAFRSAVAIGDGSNSICFRTQVDDLNESTYYGVYKLEEEGIKVKNNPNINEKNIFISFKPPKDNNGKLKPFRLYLFKEM